MQARLLRSVDDEWTAITLLVHADTPAESMLLRSWCNGHRSTRLAVEEADFQRWQQAQLVNDVACTSTLLRDVVVLWDRPFVMRELSHERFLWHAYIPDGVITRLLLDRLAWAETLDDIQIGIEQLLLEQQHSFALNESQAGAAHGPEPRTVRLALPPDTHQTA